jgi:hypothetical protein
MLGMVMRVMLNLIKLIAVVMMMLVVVMIMAKCHALKTQQHQISD